MNWTRRILRCAVLRALPGEDVLSPLAHNLCQFGHWFRLHIAEFEEIDTVSVRLIEEAHEAMHDAMRSICSDVMNSTPGKVTDLELFEKSQSELLTSLASFKTLVLTKAACYDQLTGLPLRHSLEYDFGVYQKDANRNGSLLYIALIDIDHFKQINDKYGHPVGDYVLRHLADTLKQSLRSNDPLYRFGGEEFLWLMRCNYAEQAEQSARRTVIKVRATTVLINENIPLNLTVTLGVVKVGEQEDLSCAIERADQALYEGKNAGRDRYVLKYD